ncbi:MAG: chemotaxis protein CheX [Deltaproteobacteria bacterium]|nr:chemotaxis protein CheX [Deltaproteobacteria bacterium]
MSFHYDVNFINPFLEGVLNVLSTMANVEARPGKPFLNKKRKALGDVTGVIDVSGYARGTIALSLSKESILKIVNNMLYENYTEIDDQIMDAVGELTNMITGQARAKLSEQGMSFQASTPHVVNGKGVKVEHIETAPILAIPFQTPDGNFTVEVCFTENET